MSNVTNPATAAPRAPQDAPSPAGPLPAPEAVALQRAFFACGATLPVDFRIEALRRLRASFTGAQEAVFLALEQDLGKPRFEVAGSEMAGVLSELDTAIRMLRRWSRPRRRRSPWLLFPGRAFIQPQPYGTVLIVSPWNFPFELSLTPLVGALAAGNTAVVKPSEMAPASSAVLARIVAEALPPEHALVFEGGIDASRALLGQHFDYIFFTGGEAVGRLVMRAASERLTPVTLELGGKSPAIVDAGAPLDVAARRILFGRFFNAGQACIAPDYVLVERSAHPAFLEHLRAEHARLYGRPPCPDVARIVNARHFERLVGYLRDGRVLCGGEHDAASLRIHPTVLVDVSPDAPVMREEVFGPILPVLAVADFDEAVRFVNERPRPLALYYFSPDRGRQRELLRRTSSGGVAINDTLTHWVNRDLPFGGVGASGMGRYHLEATFDTFSHMRSVQVAATYPDIPLRYPPYRGKLGMFRRILRLLG
jgi:aldehyde dehydrogenase (NAD+)